MIPCPCCRQGPLEAAGTNFEMLRELGGLFEWRPQPGHATRVGSRKVGGSPGGRTPGLLHNEVRYGQLAPFVRGEGGLRDSQRGGQSFL